jgi:hypothetical protein
MTHDNIIKLARLVGFSPEASQAPMLERFAALIASERDIGWHKIVHDECEAAIKEEREACAKVCDKLWSAAECAEAIRARGQS